MFGWWKKPVPVQEEESDQGPPDEAEKVLKIKMLCETGKWSAANLGDSSLDDETLNYEQGVYQKRKEAALELARELTDEFYRDSALYFIIELCMAGNELDDAKRLLNVIEVDFMKEKILEAYPRLRAKF